MTETSHCVGKARCPKCAAEGRDNNGDNLAMYSDGHGFCFACKYHTGGGTRPVEQEQPASDFKPARGQYSELIHRRIDEKTCRQYDYQIAVANGKEIEIANYMDSSGILVAQHIRGPNKQFIWKGSPRSAQLFGQHLWKLGGKRLVITEGEIDCMTVCQLLGNTWPVVSIPNGVNSAVKSIKDNLEFVSSYSEVVLCFDNDDAGSKAAKDIGYSERAIREDSRPFGGLQVIFLGDFLQLPPVRTDQSKPYDWAFLSQAWKEADFKTIKLEKVRRQNDVPFIEMLSGFRVGRMKPRDNQLLRSALRMNPPEHITRLMTHNVQVDKWNNYRLSSIDGPIAVFDSEVKGVDQAVEFATKNMSTPRVLQLSYVYSYVYPQLRLLFVRVANVHSAVQSFLHLFPFAWQAYKRPYVPLAVPNVHMYVVKNTNCVAALRLCQRPNHCLALGY